MQLVQYQVLEGILQWKGGRIGGSKDTIEIAAATDNPIIKHPITNMPYIPGSSLKGKIRSLLELSNENDRIKRIKEKIEEIKIKEPSKENKKEHEEWKKELSKWEKRLSALINGEPCGCGLSTCIICLAFGPHKNTDHKLGLTRLIFRDAYMAKNEDVKNIQIDAPFFTIEKITEFSIEKGLSYSEIKSENIINRHTGRASDPRQMERVIDGSLFKIEIVIRVFEGDEINNKNLVIELLKKGIQLLEKDYLGGSGSRGYGKVKFYDLKLNGKTYENLSP